MFLHELCCFVSSAFAIGGRDGERVFDEGGRMKTKIEVADRQEARQLVAGLAHPDVRVFVRIVGTLAGLPTDRARKRVLSYVADAVADDAFNSDSTT
jgi:hypothetical protein